MNFYIVRNKEGKFFRPVGYGSSARGKNWVDDASMAKLYRTIGPAKGTVTYWNKHYPQFGKPEILEVFLDIQNAKVVS